MKKTIKLRHVDCPPNSHPENVFWRKELSDYYNFVDSDDPDYLIDSGLGCHHLKYDCIKILSSSENEVANFNDFDYAFGFDDLTFGDRYLRLPLFEHTAAFLALFDRKLPDDATLLNRKFCSFVVSNHEGDPMREKFFRRLSDYKRVDSGGRWLNNVGGSVPDKLAFLRGYKFNIAFENSSSPGYTTEKLPEALAANSVPIYYGDPNVTIDFREEAMVRVRGEDDIERAVEEIIRLDNDDAAYLAKCKTPCLIADTPTYYRKQLLAFLRHIFDQPLSSARRTNKYGYQATQRRNTKPMRLTHQFIRDSVWFIYELAHGKIRRIHT